MLKQPIHSVDRDGRNVVLVPLTNCEKPAKMLPADFEDIQAAGYVGGMYMNAGYVHTGRHPGSSNYPMGRVIAGANPGQKVLFRDGDRMNLRRDNLRIIRLRSHHTR